MHVAERREFDVDELTDDLRQTTYDRRKLTVKVRHGAREYPCELSVKGEGGHVKLLEDAERGIAPGQFAVFYDGDVCAGSGVVR
jgi:tRNA-specific 2-thiouridylase